MRWLFAREASCALAMSAAVTLPACSSECRDVPWCDALLRFKTYVDVPAGDSELYVTICRNSECVDNIVPLTPSSSCLGSGGCQPSCGMAGQDATACVFDSQSGWYVQIVYGSRNQRLQDSARDGDLYTITIGSQSNPALYERTQVAKYTEYDPSNEQCGERICKKVTIEP